MAEPFKKIPGDVLASTNAACSDAGWTDVHAAWLRRPEKASLVLKFMDEQMAAEAVQPEAERVVIMASGYTGPFVNERAKGPYWMYPKGWQPKSALERSAILMGFFPGLDFSHVEELALRYCVGEGSGVCFGGESESANGGRKLVLPEGMDSGLIVVPKLEAVARLVKKPPASWKANNVAMGFLLDVFKEAVPGFHDYTQRSIGPKYERLLAATEQALLAIGAKTPGDVLVLPAQTGALFAGYSPRSSRGHMSALVRHFPLHGFGGGCLALTDPERFANGALWMDCPGTERAPHGDGDFSCCPCWVFGGRLRFDSYGVGNRSPRCGSASFVSPECSA